LGQMVKTVLPSVLWVEAPSPGNVKIWPSIETVDPVAVAVEPPSTAKHGEGTSTAEGS
jgi:hypothetical protein